MTSRNWILTCLLLSLPLLAAGTHAVEQSPSDEPEDSRLLTEALVEQRIATVTETEPDNSQLARDYRAVLEQVRQIGIHNASLAYFEGAVTAAGSREAEVRERIDKIDTLKTTLDQDALDKMSSADLDDLTVSLRTQLDGWVDTRDSLDRRIATQPTAGDTIAARLEAIDKRLAELPGGAIAVEESATPSPYEASQWLLVTERDALETERRALRADLASQPYRFSRRRVEREEALLWIKILESDLQWVIARRSQQDEELPIDLQGQFEPNEPGMEVATQLVESRKELLKLRRQLTRELTSAESYKNALGGTIADMRKAYEGTREIVDTARDSSDFGPLLIKSRRQLDRAEHAAALGRPSIAMGDLVIRNTRHEERLNDITSTTTYTDKRLSAVTDLASVQEALRDQVIELVRGERTLLTEVVRLEDSLLQALRDIRLTESKLLDLREELVDFLQGHILWVASQTPLHLNFIPTLKADLEDLAEVVSASKLTASVKALAWSLLGMLLLAGRQSFKTRLVTLGQAVRKPRSDSIFSTLQALVVTLLLALPLPVFIYALAAALHVSIPATSAYIQHALNLVAIIVMFASYLHYACQADGVVSQHLQWNDTWCKELLRLSNWARYVLSVLVGLALAFAGLQSETYVNVLEQVSLLILYVAVTAYLYGIIRRLFSDESERARRYYATLALLAACVYVLQAVWRGYVIAPLLILEPLLGSVLFLFLVVLLHSLLTRWLRITRRRIRFKQLTETREDEEAEHEESYTSDLGELNTTANELLKALAFALGIVGLFLIWSPLFSGVSALNDVVLWSSVSQEGGTDVTQTITLLSLFVATIIGAVAFFAASKLPSLLELILHSYSGISPGSRYAAVTLLNYLIVGIGFIAVLSTLGVQWSKLQWLVAALGVGIGFGLQELVANFISGLIIFFERPIRVGDLVTVGDSQGTVTKIRMRATTILDFDRRELLVPNKEFVTGRLLNWTLSDSINRLTFDVGIAYGSDVGKALEVMRETVAAHPRVIEDPEPFVIFNLFGDNALNLSVRVYLDSYENRLRVLSELHEAVDRAYAEAGIVIAFPQRDIHLDMDKPLQISINEPGQ